MDKEPALVTSFDELKKKNESHYMAAARKRLALTAVLIFLVIPALIALTVFLGSKRLYMPLSLLILVMIMAPFFMIFERRKPRAREVVLIAMMSALTVASHTFFHIAFPVQIGTAMVIISGISLGPEAGFLIGAMSRFVCNFYMGQGAWTPWQMFCWGLLGFLAGLAFNREISKQNSIGNFKKMMAPVLCVIFSELVAYISFLVWPGNDKTFFGWRVYLFGIIGLLLAVIFQKGKLKADNITMAVFTFVVTFVIYGGIMNFAAMCLSMNEPGSLGIGVKALKALYVSGVGYDFYHALTAAICVFVIGTPMVNKLERIKIKYGIYK
ncbi:ECF-type riboflavin transporter, S component [Eubacterium sulci ATCC 35585]|nr:ECF-type riboflavin transporter, S component [Eubacterium sulci ATCC 35585]